MLQWGRDRSVAEIPRGRGETRGHGVALQWGRDRSVAEMRRRAATARATVWLQWGRDRSVAEIAAGVSKHSPSVTCFNGAATDRSRQCGASGRGDSSAMPLQWGRDRSVAEMWGLREGRLLCDAASMGPRPIGRGNHRQSVIPARARSRFNGAATDRSRKLRPQRAARRRAGGFNGAATDRSRKFPTHDRIPPLSAQQASMGPRPIGRGNSAPPSTYTTRRRVLQWGRDRSVAEIALSTALEGTRDKELQWGRDRSVAEIRGRGAWVRQGMAGFNG